MQRCAGIDVVINVTGIGTSREPTTLYSAGTANLLAGMGEHDVRRLVSISAPVATD